MASYQFYDTELRDIAGYNGLNSKPNQVMLLFYQLCEQIKDEKILNVHQIFI